MLEKLPGVVGHVLRDRRAGLDKLAFNRSGLRVWQGMLQLSSLAFADHAPIPARYTAGEGSRRRCNGRASPATPRAWC
ncbi:hypothetical protein [Ramlibacter lithotrophicus]|uniref:hypothetical protein n=1 Tax=Ramlibacter lithotrophicus TaxID=2606681 RepID=UPI001EE22DF0|nr:hypothetical protein [Ramlibacter lithotrophicus]